MFRVLLRTVARLRTRFDPTAIRVQEMVDVEDVHRSLRRQQFVFLLRGIDESEIVEEVMDYRTYCWAITKTYCWAIAISR